jgi:hypothetical protein
MMIAMSFERKSRHADGASTDLAKETGYPGKRTLTQDLPLIAPVQRAVAPAGDVGNQAQDNGRVHAAAARGTSGPSTELPYRERIQDLFGRHDVSKVQAHVGGAAAQGAAAMGAEAFATGDHVAFARAPDLHTAAHEAAHVVQQRAGVQLKGGVGQVGDKYESHADAVADSVVRGDSAEALLDQFAPDGKGASSGGGVQMAGHSGVMIFGTVAIEDANAQTTDTAVEVDARGKEKQQATQGSLLKRVEPTEAREYQRVMEQQKDPNNGANGTFPQVFGVYNDFPEATKGSYGSLAEFRTRHTDGDQYIEIASVKVGRNDSIKDFKIGTQTANAHELVAHGHITGEGANARAAQKEAREGISDKMTESGAFGLRDSDQMRTKRGLGILIGKKTSGRMPEFINKWLSRNTLKKVQGEVARHRYAPSATVFKDLNNIEAYIKASDTVYLASSLVVNWSADRAKQNETDTLRLIDLAHPITEDTDGEDGEFFKEAKQGMLHGIQNLRRILNGEDLQRRDDKAEGGASEPGPSSEPSTSALAKPGSSEPLTERS